MMRDDLQRLAGSATADQMGEAIAQMARLIARYHATLRAEKMAPQLAGELTMQMAAALVHRTLWPHEEPG